MNPHSVIGYKSADIKQFLPGVKKKMITLDITLLIHIGNILVLIVILNALLYKPVRSILLEREKAVSALSNDIETFDKNTKLRQEEINQKLVSARGKAKAELEAAKSSALGASAASIDKVRQEATAAKEGKLAEIQKEVSSAREQLKGQIGGFAADMAGKILGRSL